MGTISLCFFENWLTQISKRILPLLPCFSFSLSFFVSLSRSLSLSVSLSLGLFLSLGLSLSLSFSLFLSLSLSLSLSLTLSPYTYFFLYIIALYICNNYIPLLHIQLHNTLNITYIQDLILYADCTLTYLWALLLLRYSMGSYSLFTDSTRHRYGVRVLRARQNSVHRLNTYLYTCRGFISVNEVVLYIYHNKLNKIINHCYINNNYIQQLSMYFYLYCFSLDSDLHILNITYVHNIVMYADWTLTSTHLWVPKELRYSTGFHSLLTDSTKHKYGILILRARRGSVHRLNTYIYTCSSQTVNESYTCVNLRLFSKYYSSAFYPNCTLFKEMLHSVVLYIVNINYCKIRNLVRYKTSLLLSSLKLLYQLFIDFWGIIINIKGPPSYVVPAHRTALLGGRVLRYSRPFESRPVDPVRRAAVKDLEAFPERVQTLELRAPVWQESVGPLPGLKQKRYRRR